MPAIDTIGAAYERRKNARRALEAEARVDVNRKLEAMDRELAEMVRQAIAQKTPISAIAREMGCSRTLIYAIRDQHAAPTTSEVSR